MPVTRDAEYLPYVYTCNRCRACTVTNSHPQIPVCPAVEFRRFFTYSGGGKAYTAQGVIERKVPIDQRLAEIAFTCQLCGACMALCPPQFDTVSMIRDLRDHVVGAGVFLSEAHRGLVENLRATGSPWGAEAQGCDSEASPTEPAVGAPGTSQDGAAQPTTGEKALLYAGCTGRHTAGGRRMFAAIRALLDRADVRYDVLTAAEEPTCGCFELNLGLKRAFPRIARRTIDRLNRLAPDKVIVTGPSCHGVFGKDYMDAGDLEPHFVHVTEVLLDAVGRGSLRPDEPTTPIVLTYHDPCALGRGSGITEPPRGLLAALPGVELVEMRRNRSEALCCGSGPGMREISPEFAAFTARERARDVIATGAELVVTACAACVESLRSSLGEAGSPVAVMDLYGFLLERTTSGG